jgi:hypothetical protein
VSLALLRLNARFALSIYVPPRGGVKEKTGSATVDFDPILISEVGIAVPFTL